MWQAQLKDFVYFLKKVSVELHGYKICRHAREHAVGPECVFTGTFIIIRDLLRHTLKAVNIALLQFLPLQCRREIYKADHRKCQNGQDVRDDFLNIEFFHVFLCYFLILPLPRRHGGTEFHSLFIIEYRISNIEYRISDIEYRK